MKKRKSIFDAAWPVIQSADALFNRANFQTVLNSLSVVSDAFNSRLVKYPDLVEKVEALSERCWFVSMGVDLGSMETLLHNIDISSVASEEVDEVMVDFYRQWFERLSVECLRRYPEREGVLDQAFNAHRAGMYALSIPVFFAQADGILFAEKKCDLFTKKYHVSKVVAELLSCSPEEDQRFALVVDRLMLSPLSRNDKAFELGEKQRNEMTTPIGLNRNMVMHGLDVDYHTEINSFKAFSLLAYIVSIMEDDLIPKKGGR